MLQTTAQNLRGFVENAILVHEHAVHIHNNQTSWYCSFEIDDNNVYPAYVKSDGAMWLTLKNDRVYSLLTHIESLGVEVSIQKGGLRESFREKYTRYSLQLPASISWQLCQALTCLVGQACNAVEG